MTKRKKDKDLRHHKSSVKKFFKFVTLTGLWSLIFIIGLFVYYGIGLPSVKTLIKHDKIITDLQVQYSNKNLIKKYGTIIDTSIAYSDIPIHLIEALVATEDRRFFEHYGVDLMGILRALYVDIKAGYIKQGGSTITQQLAKMMFLSRERTLKRKIQEIILAIEIETLFSKEQIMSFYLNKAYFGAGKHGIKNASEFYFNKHVSKLNLEESAMLVGLLRAPNRYSPVNNPELAKRRANQIIANMANAGFLNEDIAIGMIADDMEYIYGNSFNKKNQSYYFADWVKNQIYDFIGNNNSHISALTTLDEKLQTQLEEAIYNFTEKNKTRLGKSQIALIAMSKDGAILAMSGGKNYDISPFNRSIYAYRQAGSAFKLFVYLTALEKGINPQDIFIDEPIAVGNWYPENYRQKYYGEVTVTEAFAKSLNSVAVQISELCGKREVAKIAERLGITSSIPQNDPTIALGSVEVNLLELTTAYTAIINDGYPIIPYFINRIEDNNGNILYKRVSSGLNRVISKKTVKKIREMLYEVVNSGTGQNAKINKLMRKNFLSTGRMLIGKDKYAIGGKTGTSQNYRDAWFIGYVDNLVVGVWIGNDDNTPTNRIVGGLLPAELWREFVEKIID
jgi:penicillin-binding protein 1A